MFFEDLEEIPKIASRTGFSIFVLKKTEIEKAKAMFKNSPILFPKVEEGKKTLAISIDAVRGFMRLTASKQKNDQFFLIESPEKMGENAANAFLKNLEEPRENYHFVFLTERPEKLLKTIVSRAQIFILKRKGDILSSPIEASEEIKNYAKRLVVARDADLPDLADEISKAVKKKDRNFAILIVETAIEISYKTFFTTKNPKFLTKLPNLIELHKNLSLNGHVKLHFVADML